MMKLEPIGSNLIFQFTDSVVDGKFISNRSSGIVQDLGNRFLEYGALCRRIRVHHIGPQCKNVSIGNEYVVENLKWTKSFIVDGQEYWMTREQHLLSGITQQIP